jgi:hypothetical protein
MPRLLIRGCIAKTLVSPRCVTQCISKLTHTCRVMSFHRLQARKDSSYIYKPIALPPTFTAVSFLGYSILKMEGTCSSETSVEFQQAARRYLFITAAVRTSNRTRVYCQRYNIVSNCLFPKTFTDILISKISLLRSE